MLDLFTTSNFGCRPSTMRSSPTDGCWRRSAKPSSSTGRTVAAGDLVGPTSSSRSPRRSSEVGTTGSGQALIPTQEDRTTTPRTSRIRMASKSNWLPIQDRLFQALRDVTLGPHCAGRCRVGRGLSIAVIGCPGPACARDWTLCVTSFRPTRRWLASTSRFASSGWAMQQPSHVPAPTPRYLGSR